MATTSARTASDDGRDRYLATVVVLAVVLSTFISLEAAFAAWCHVAF